MSWTKFITTVLVLYILYYGLMILYDIFLKKDKKKKGKTNKLVFSFEEEVPVRVDKIIKDQKEEDINQEQKTRENVPKLDEQQKNKIKESKPKTYSLNDFMGMAEEKEPINEAPSEIGIGGYDLKTLKSHLSLKIKEKVSKVQFEEATI